MYNFNTEEITNKLIEWVRNWFDKNGGDCNAVIGISGGKDSSVAAAVCVKALGKDRVIGVLMPNTYQSDIEDAHNLCDFLGIKKYIVNIGSTFNALVNEILSRTDISMSEQATINLAPRLRMSALYAVSQSLNGRVINTCNLSEDYVGYATKYGDAAGDVSLFANLTVAEVKAIGKYLGLPEELVDKTPSDGLCGKTDEDNLGFTYEVLDKYIRTGECENKSDKVVIDYMHKKNLFKMRPMDSFVIPV